MKSWLAAAALAASALLLVAAAAVIGLGLAGWFGLARRKRHSPAEIRRRSEEKGEFPLALLDLPWIVERLRSPLGYELVVHALPGRSAAEAAEGRGGRLALFHHGFSWNWLGALKYARRFIEAGWTVVTYDSAGHGESGGPRPSFGVRESEDLKAVADWALGRWPSPEGFGVHGESLGAATALLHAAIDPRVTALVADCSYSSVVELLEGKLRRWLVPPPLRRLAIALSSFLVSASEGFSIAEADPAAASLRARAAILFVHGSADQLVPAAMSASMAARRRDLLPASATELLLVPGARHAASRNADPEAYDAAVQDFVERALTAARSRGKIGE